MRARPIHLDPATVFGQTLRLPTRLRRHGVETTLVEGCDLDNTQVSAHRGALRGVPSLAANDRLFLRGRWAISSSEFANKHGIYLGRRSARIHAALYRRTGGKVGGHLPGLPAARIVLVDHVGAKSGVCRTSPLIYHEADGVVAVVASKAGQPTNPAWLHNLIAHPETTIQLGSEVRQVRARVASDEERDRLWPKLLAVYPGWDFFQDLAKDRKIPVVILEPREGSRRSQ
jgi:deazaflavin-dependent oxidoreductase (nitroreductase family)